MALVTELLQANMIRIFDTQIQMWIAAAQADRAINEMYEIAEKSDPLIVQSLKDSNDDFESIESYASGIKENNPWIFDLLK